MALSAGGRRFWFTIHVASSVGWIGAVATFIALDITTVTSQDVAVLRAAYIAMDLMTQWVIVPLAFAAFGTGLIVSLGTKWGLFRHYWVVISLVLTLISGIVLLAKVPLISNRAQIAADPATTSDALRHLGNMLPHSIGGTVILLVVLVLNIYKPSGLTKYGYRKQMERS